MLKDQRVELNNYCYEIRTSFKADVEQKMQSILNICITNNMTSSQSAGQNSTIVNLCKKRTLNNNEIALLSKGLSFCPNIKRPNYYQTQVDLLKFERHLTLKEYFNSTSNPSNEVPSENNMRDPKTICKSKSTFTPECKDQI